MNLNTETLLDTLKTEQIRLQDKVANYIRHGTLPSPEHQHEAATCSVLIRCLESIVNSENLKANPDQDPEKTQIIEIPTDLSLTKRPQGFCHEHRPIPECPVCQIYNLVRTLQMAKSERDRQYEENATRIKAQATAENESDNLRKMMTELVNLIDGKRKGLELTEWDEIRKAIKKEPLS